MLKLEEAKKFISEHCGDGWLTLVDIVYDNLPTEIVIKEVFQKYGSLEIRYEGEDDEFEYLVSNVNFISKKICEMCGKSGGYSIIDGWETTLCKVHHDKSEAKKKYRK